MDSTSMPSSPDTPQRGVDVWKQAIEQTRRRSPASFEQWFSSVQFDRLDEGVLALTARDEFVRDWVKTHFLPEMLTHIEHLLGARDDSGVRVEWTITSDLTEPVCEPRQRPSTRPRS